MNALQENNPDPAPRNEDAKEPPTGLADAPACGRAASPAAVAGLVNHTITCRDMPVSAVKVFRRDVSTVKTLPAGVVPSKYGRAGVDSEGGKITEFSERSRYRLLHTVKNCAVDFFSMITLTYPAEFPTSGRKVKRNFNAIRKRLLRRFPGILGVWFLEFQKRGAPHFHILVTLKLSEHGTIQERTRMRRNQGPKKYKTVLALEEMLSAWWFSIVDSQDPKHLAAGCAWEEIENSDGALRYAAAHASKPHQKRVPEEFVEVGRFWGVIGKVKIPLLKIFPADTAEVFSRVGVDALSNKGRLKKYLWDSAEKFDDETPIAVGDHWRNLRMWHLEPCSAPLNASAVT